MTIIRDGRGLLVQRAGAGRPYLHPLLAADGASELTQDAPGHHPWQHGVMIGLNDIDGVGYWTEGLLAGCAASDGSVRARPLEAPAWRGASLAWTAEADYRRPDGRPHLHERQDWTWTPRSDGGCLLDLDWTLSAVDGAVRCGRYDYGGLFIRMPWHAGLAVAVLASHGATRREDIDARPAAWVAMALPGAKGTWNTLAVADHPANPGHPQAWRFDGGYGFGPGRCIAGAWGLAPGRPCRQRYRLANLPGRPDPAAIAAAITE